MWNSEKLELLSFCRQLGAERDSEKREQIKQIFEHFLSPVNLVVLLEKSAFQNV